MASAVYDQITNIIEDALKNTERILHGEPIQKKAHPKEDDRYESSGKKYVSKDGKYRMTVFPKKLKEKTPVKVPSLTTKSSSGKSRVTRKSQRVHSWGTTDYSTKKSISVVSTSTIQAPLDSPTASDYTTDNGKLASSRCHSALNQIKEVPYGQKAFKSDVVFADGGLLYEVQLRGIIDSLSQKGKLMVNGKEYKF